MLTFAPDWKIAKKSFWAMSFAALALIPLDWLALSVFKAPARTDRPIRSAALAASNFAWTLETFEAKLSGSALFGGGPGGNLQALQTSMQELIKDYRLKGIVDLSEKEAIMEDAKVQKTVFVKAGDKLGPLSVKEIRSETIVLAYYGEEKELRIE